MYGNRFPIELVTVGKRPQALIASHSLAHCSDGIRKLPIRRADDVANGALSASQQPLALHLPRGYRCEFGLKVFPNTLVLRSRIARTANNEGARVPGNIREIELGQNNAPLLPLPGSRDGIVQNSFEALDL